MVAAEHHRDGAARRNIANLAVDDGVASLDPGRHDVGVPGVDDGQDLERLDAQL